MELDHLKSIWNQKVLPSYSADEIEEIFVQRTKKTFGKLQNILLKDTLTALILTAIFIGILFYFDFVSRLYWTLGLMGLALRNVIIYSIQSQLLNRSLLYQKDIVTSLQSTQKRLRLLQKFYLIWPTTLSGILTVYYQLSYGSVSSGMLVMQTIGIMGVVALASYGLSYFSVKKYRNLIDNYIIQLNEEY